MKDLLEFNYNDSGFKNNIGKLVVIFGEVYSNGVYYDEKYLTIKINDNHYVDIYPEKDFNLSNFAKGRFVILKGVLDSIGTGVFIHHAIRKAHFIASY